MELSDFEISVDARGDGSYLVSVRGPMGGAQAIARLPFEGEELATRLAGLEQAILHSAAGFRDIRRSATTQERPEEFGAALFEALITDDVRESYRGALAYARHEGQGLRIRLRLQAPELATLPWEFLYDRREGEFVALSAETPLVRYLELDRPTPALRVGLPLRILCMIASPSDMPQLDVEAERARIERAVDVLVRRGHVALRWVERGTFQNLQAMLGRADWNVFHFVGHGGFDDATGEGVLAFEDGAPTADGQRGSTHHVPASVIGQLLNARPSLRLVLLNACDGARASATDLFSSTAAVLVRRGIPAVVAMQYQISDRAALEFAQSFYGAVISGKPVDVAVAEARTAIRGTLGSLEWATPLLFMRAASGMLFTLPDVSTANHPLVRRPQPVPGPPVPGSPDPGPPDPGPAAPAPRRMRRWWMVAGGAVSAVGALLLVLVLGSGGDDELALLPLAMQRSLATDTAVAGMVGALTTMPEDARAASLAQLDLVLDRRASVVPLARAALTEFVRRQTRWRTIDDRCLNSAATRADVAKALDVLAKPRPAGWLDRRLGRVRAATPGTLDLDSTNLAGMVLAAPADLRQFTFVDACLTGARLQGAQLDSARLDGARLDSVDLTGASLRHASLEFAEGREVILARARLEGANLNGAVLPAASLQGARLACTTLQGTLLDSSQLFQASMPWTFFEATSLVDVSDWTHLEPPGVRHAFVRTARLDSASKAWAYANGADTLHASGVSWTVAMVQQWAPDSLCARTAREP